MTDISSDSRIVLTLDAGGTSFRFSAMRAGQTITPTIAIPSNGSDLDACLRGVVEGFTRTREQCPEPPAAISFAFPGPADYPRGIIGDLPNLPRSATLASQEVCDHLFEHCSRGSGYAGVGR